MIKKRKRKGFTLIELLVALAIFAIFLSGPLFDIAMRINLRVRNMNNAKMIAQEYMERLRSYGFDNPQLLNDGSNSDLDEVTDFDHDTTITLGGVVYTIGYNIKDNFPSNNTKTIRLHVLWDDGLGHHHLAFTTVRTNVNY